MSLAVSQYGPDMIGVCPQTLPTPATTKSLQGNFPAGSNVMLQTQAAGVPGPRAVKRLKRVSLSSWTTTLNF